MWCTRWFLPLFLLPVPAAPSYFLLLFIFSLVLHAQPCFYCICLLTALFFSSCYWQSVPLSTKLTTPWLVPLPPPVNTSILNTTSPLSFKLIETYADALEHIMPEYNYTAANVTPPTHAPVPDRCWIDCGGAGSGSSIFEPANITAWEVEGVWMAKREVERQAREVQEAIERAEQEERRIAEQKRKDAEEKKRRERELEERNKEAQDGMGDHESSTIAKTLPSLWSDIQDFTDALFASLINLAETTHAELRLVPASTTTNASAAPEPVPAAAAAAAAAAEEPELSSDATPMPEKTDAKAPTEPVEAGETRQRPEESLPWLRREYDLRRYGLDIILDFGWSRTP